MAKGSPKPRRKATSERPSLEGVLLVDTYDLIAPFYGLTNADAFEELTEYLVGLSCRDQEFEPPEAGPMQDSQRRAEGHKLALTMRDHAARMIESLETIHEALGRFDDVVSVHPPLLEAIFDVDTGDPRRPIFPERIAILLTFFQEVDWDKAAEALARLAAMPVRENLARGPVRNETLRRAVAACRTYWRDVEINSWSMSSLKNKNVRDVNDRWNLQGTCEAFVADLLTQCGLVHGLQDLCSAWTAVDQE